MMNLIEILLSLWNQALALSKNGQQSYIIRSNLINVYNHANYPEKALTYVTCNERLASGDTEVAFEKAYALYLLNRRDEAEKILLQAYDEIKTSDPEKVWGNAGPHCFRCEFSKICPHFKKK